MPIIKWTIPEKLRTNKNIESVLIFTKTYHFNARDVFLGRRNCIMIFRDDQIDRICHWHSFEDIKENCLSRNIIIMNEEEVKLWIGYI